MQNIDFYSNAHLIVAAIRVLERRNSTPPSIEEVCRTISFSLEQGNLICKKLNEMGIIEVVEGAYGTRLFIKNHLAIEEIPRETKGSDLEKELKKFQNTRTNYAKKIESFQTEQAKKQKNLFAELEKRLKDSLDKKGK
ncbi:MAG: hypothetical protein BA864_10205 [Desulfuromonadales bacterium C00003093]|nr:MAG: hypothetical protein BA864_10205 [Desulfuromonadales bacterium C00003093]